MRKHKKARLLTMYDLQARPCKVDGAPALFHRWAEDDEVLLTANAKEIVDVIRQTYALVEYQDGTVHMVAPELVQFTDKETQA
jgi:hypothetical protein